MQKNGKATLPGVSNLDVRRKSEMKNGKMVLRIAGLLLLFVAAYLFWAHLRIEYVIFGSDKSWPYPDAWIVEWEKNLNEKHPAPEDSIKMEGEIPRIEIYLKASILASVAAGISCLYISRRKPNPAEVATP
ncbi:hypothetical protein [Cerasicoccus fimbriatus]|uniref:hypothetical protein n=1 Tax=Cerasicoccus fimbriatus TaxID=3014554 RepID=UPI0022B534EE|nr:hypothetical protein [Cerasicoccus sp. TK19100]